jgi:hypothetical protein
MTKIMSYLLLFSKRLFFTTFAFQNMALPQPHLTPSRESLACLIYEFYETTAEDGLAQIIHESKDQKEQKQPRRSFSGRFLAAFRGNRAFSAHADSPL